MIFNPYRGMTIFDSLHILARGDSVAIVNTAQPITSASNFEMIQNIINKYPFCRSEVLATTVFQRPIPTLVIGDGPRKVIFTASFAPLSKDAVLFQ